MNFFRYLSNGFASIFGSFREPMISVTNRPMFSTKTVVRKTIKGGGTSEEVVLDYEDLTPEEKAQFDKAFDDMDRQFETAFKDFDKAFEGFDDIFANRRRKR